MAATEESFTRGETVSVDEHPRVQRALANQHRSQLEDVKALVALATLDTENDEFSNFMASNMVAGEVGTAVRELQAEDRARRTRAAAVAIVSLGNKAKDLQKTLVEEVRAYRAAERNKITLIKRIQRAMNYGFVTGNYLPLQALVGAVHPFNALNNITDASVAQKLTEVPEDWHEATGQTVEAATPTRGPARKRVKAKKAVGI